MESITLDWKVFKAGISTADGVEDGGYSPLYGGHNLQEEKDGLLYPQPAVDYLAWNEVPTGEPVIYVKSPYLGSTVSAIYGMLVDDTNKVYSQDSINDIDLETTVTNTDFYRDGGESGAAFQTHIYVATEDDVMKIALDGNGNYSSTDDDWWSVTRGHSNLSGAKSIVLTIEDTLYIINKNYVSIWDGSSSQSNALTLPPDFYATAAIKHTNGRDMIVFGSRKKKASDSAAAGFVVYYINLVDLEFTDELELTSEVQGVWNVGGTMYVTTEEWLGIFTGTSIDRVYHLNLNLDDSSAADLREDQIWTHHGTITHQGYLLIPDGNKILAVGNIGGGTILWHPFDGYADMDIVHMVFNLGNKYVGVYGYTGARWSGTLVSTILELQDHTGASKWAGNKIRFNQKTWVRKISIDFETLETGDDFSIGHIKEDGTEVTLRDITFTKYGAINTLDIYPNVLTDIYQPLIEWTTGGVGIKKVTIFYEPGE